MAFSSHSNLIFLDPFTTDGSNLVQATQGHSTSTYFQNSQDAAASLYSPAASTMAVGSQSGAQMSAVHSRTHSHHLISPPSVGGTASASAAGTGGAVGVDRRRSPSSTRSVSSIDHAQRRATHNAIERARRESLNGQFQDLASAVPSLIHVRRPSKATIVEKSLDYIRSFKEHLANRDQYIKKLQLRNLALHDEVNRLRKQIGLEPLTEGGESAVASDMVLPSHEDIISGKVDANKHISSGSPLKTVVTAAALSDPTHSSAPGVVNSVPAAAADDDLQQQQRKRQQSLNLGISGHEAIRPLLRVRTAAIAKRTNSMALTRNGGDDDSDSSSPLQMSPLSAPILTHVPQLPLGIHDGNRVFMNTNSNASSRSIDLAVSSSPSAANEASMMAAMSAENQAAAAAAAAAVAAAAYVAQTTAAQQQQQALSAMSVNPMTAVQFGDVIGMHATPSMQDSPMSSYMPQHQQRQNGGSSLGMIDYSKLSEVLAMSTATSTPSTATAASSMPAAMASTSNGMSDAPLCALTGITSHQFSSISQ
ncbi:hypothetical protein GQ54DRAFT_51763 [Martensiomyces pterosporus]|nr:hypothetical protein GQ54DRAFT_51763 [Martensiomyces pterosporus]